MTDTPPPSAPPTSPPPSAPIKRSLLDRFPALARITDKVGAREIPYISQLEYSDCGAACLTMVLHFHGKEVPLSAVRSSINVTRDGVTARAIVDGAGRFGLFARGIKVDVPQVEMLPRGTILHWEFNHFVVFDRVLRGGKLLIVDPAVGTRELSVEEFRQKFTGVAIEVKPTTAFAKEKSKDGNARPYLRELFNESSLLTKIIVVSLVLRLLAMILPLITGRVIDQVVPRSDYSLLWVLIGAIVGMVLFEALGGMIRSHLMIHLRTLLDAKLTLGFLDHMVALPIGFFQKRSSGDLMMRVGSNATMREVVTSQTLSAIIDGVFVLLYAVVIMWVNMAMGLVAMGLALLPGLIYLAARSRNMRLMSEDLDRQAKSQSYLVQLLGGMETLKTAGAERIAVEKWSSLYADVMNVGLRRGRLTAVIDALRTTVAQLSPMIILAVGTNAVMKKQISLGDMLAMNSLAMSLFGPLSQLIESLLQMQLLKGYAGRIDDVMKTPAEQDRDKVKPPPRLRGELALKDVSFRYAPDRPWVLQHVSLDIPVGAKVALVGPSGSGKSTLLHLLAGTLVPSAGKIFYDGVNVHEYDLQAVRQQLGMVPQHPFVFGSSIRENIALTVPDASLDKIRTAAKMAALVDDINAMPLGFDTPISDGGASLSGGQRQRIAIARAVLREPRVLLFDEATSALDNATEAQIVANLRHLGCTQITVAHRLSTVQNYDLIVVMENGQVVEQGNHAALMAKQGTYHKLVLASQGNSPAMAAPSPTSKEAAGAKPAAQPARR